MADENKKKNESEEYQEYLRAIEEDQYQEYLRAIKKDPDAYSSFSDFLGANAMQICEGCDNIVEYDEVDENGYCFDCQNEEDEEECDED